MERDIQSLEEAKKELKQKHLDQKEQELDEKKRKVAAALCGMVEVWMTDLSYVLAEDARILVAFADYLCCKAGA